MCAKSESWHIRRGLLAIVQYEYHYLVAADVSKVMCLNARLNVVLVALPGVTWLTLPNVFLYVSSW